MAAPVTYKIAVLFQSNYIYGREIVIGISSYMASHRVSWVIFLTEDFADQLESIEHMQCDGIIMDYEHPRLRTLAANSRIPIVAIGSSYVDESDYPPGISYVATDNFQLVKLAYDHLVEAGLSSFALLSVVKDWGGHWAKEREHAFTQLTQRDMLETRIYREPSTSPMSWALANEQLVAWVKSLPKPIGIIGVIDGRAKQLLQACLLAGIAVPEQVAIIGIDNDPIVRNLTRLPLSSVAQNTEEMGRIAARIMHQKLTGVNELQRVIVPPIGVNAQASSKHEKLKDPHVMRARHFIRQYACLGVKTQQVADYVGISRSSLESHYRAELGYSVHDEILRFKLDAAKAILAREEGNLSEVAVNCGFTSVHYMHNVFKRELGCSPRAYQAQLLSAKASAKT